MAGKKRTTVKKPNIPKNQLDGKGAFGRYPLSNNKKKKGK